MSSNGNGIVTILQNFISYCSQFVDALRKLNEVIKSCFSYKLEPNYELKIRQFENLYRKLGISETLKAHVLFHDIPRFLSSRDHGLGKYSEQAIESAHALENETWKNYKVDLANKNYGTQMYRSTLELNGKNIK